MVLLGKITRGWDCGLGSPRCAGRASYRGMVIHRWLLYEQRQHLGAWSQFSLAAPATGTWQHSDTTRPRSDRALSKNTLRIHLRRVASMRPAGRLLHVGGLIRFSGLADRVLSRPYEYVTNCELISNLWLRPPCVDRTCHHAPHSGTSPGPLALFADAQGVPPTRSSTGPATTWHTSCHGAITTSEGRVTSASAIAAPLSPPTPAAAPRRYTHAHAPTHILIVARCELSDPMGHSRNGPRAVPGTPATALPFRFGRPSAVPGAPATALPFKFGRPSA